MTSYARMYRFGITPRERYATTAAASIAGLPDREEAGRSRPWAVRSAWVAAGAWTQDSAGPRPKVPARWPTPEPRLADEQNRAAVVQAAPAGLERHCPALSRD